MIGEPYRAVFCVVVRSHCLYPFSVVIRSSLGEARTLWTGEAVNPTTPTGHPPRIASGLVSGDFVPNPDPLALYVLLNFVGSVLRLGLLATVNACLAGVFQH
jgi:hypothetical protein